MKKVFQAFEKLGEFQDMEKNVKDILDCMSNPSSWKPRSVNAIAVMLASNPSVACQLLNGEQYAQFQSLLSTAKSNYETLSRTPSEQQSLINAIANCNLS